MLAVATVAPTRELGPALSIRQTKINQPAARTLQGRLMAFIYLGRLQAGMGKWVCQDFAMYYSGQHVTVMFCCLDTPLSIL